MRSYEECCKRNRNSISLSSQRAHTHCRWTQCGDKFVFVHRNCRAFFHRHDKRKWWNRMCAKRREKLHWVGHVSVTCHRVLLIYALHIRVRCIHTFASNQIEIAIGCDACVSVCVWGLTHGEMAKQKLSVDFLVVPKLESNVSKAFLPFEFID